MPKRNHQTSELEELAKVIPHAVKTGVKAITNERPIFKGFEDYIAGYLNEDIINERFHTLYKELSKEKFGMNEKANIIYNDIINYVASGKALEDKEKEILLGKSLEGKTNFLQKLFHRPKFEGEKELHNSLEVFDDFYNLLLSNKGEYAKLMPELTKKAVYMKKMKILGPALHIMGAHGLMNEKEIRHMYKEATKEANETQVEFKKKFEEYFKPEKEEKYIVPQKVAASILGFAGIMLMVFNLTITGAIIGSETKLTIGTAGMFIVFFALLLFFRPLKRNFKN